MKTLVSELTRRFLLLRRSMMPRPSGREPSSVRKKMAQVRSMPAAMVESMVEKLIDIFPYNQNSPLGPLQGPMAVLYSVFGKTQNTR